MADRGCEWRHGGWGCNGAWKAGRRGKRRVLLGVACWVLRLSDERWWALRELKGSRRLTWLSWENPGDAVMSGTYRHQKILTKIP